MIEVSLIIPVLNEESSIELLVSSIQNQTRVPNEIIFVDGGSTDKTIEIIESFSSADSSFKLVKAGQATPGRGRNIGVENARYKWIAFTDSGIRLDPDWLDILVKVVEKNDSIDIVYGNCEVRIENFFEQCATFAYVSPRQFKDGEWWRGPFIASSLLRREVWESVGGFPDIRAAEDLIFMEAVEKAGFKIDYAPRAKVIWQLRPDITSTFQKFVLYSKHNVWVNREWDWHYGILKQYLVILPFFILGLIHSWWWLLVIVFWGFIRTAKRIFAHHNQFGLGSLINPVIFFEVMFIIFIVDIATFIGWGEALFQGKPESSLVND